MYMATIEDIYRSADITQLPRINALSDLNSSDWMIVYSNGNLYKAYVSSISAAAYSKVASDITFGSIYDSDAD